MTKFGLAKSKVLGVLNSPPVSTGVGVFLLNTPRGLALVRRGQGYPSVTLNGIIVDARCTPFNMGETEVQSDQVNGNHITKRRNTPFEEIMHRSSYGLEFTVPGGFYVGIDIHLHF